MTIWVSWIIAIAGIAGIDAMLSGTGMSPVSDRELRLGDILVRGDGRVHVNRRRRGGQDDDEPKLATTSRRKAPAPRRA